MAFTATISEVIATDKTGLLAKHPSWERAPLSEVASILNGAPFDSTLFSTSQGFPLIRIRDVVSGTTSTFYTGPIEETFIVNAGEILVGMDGDFNAGFWGATPALLNQRVCKITPDESLYSKKLLSYVLPGYLAAINAATPSITVKHLSSKTIAEIELPLPPYNEQFRIVEKLEELLSDLDAGVAELKAAQAKLVRYRQSLLKAAVEGALTAEWRQHNTPEETGAQLLQRILSERRARWEAKQLAKFAEQGKAPPKDWQKKYPEPVQSDVRNLPDLPEGWAWASLDQLTEFITSGSRGWADYYSAEGAIFIRSQNINKDRLDLSDTAFVTPPRNNDGIRASVQKHDLLLTITGANVGKTACVEITLNEAYVSQHVALIRLVEAALDNFIHLYLTSSSGGRGQLDKEAYGAGKPGLNLQQVGSVHIPLPGRAEISALMAILKTQLEAMSEQKQSIDGLLKQSTAQRKNILRAAFSGQLVPQDPNDEPASALLARIRAQREADTGASATKRGRKAKGAA